MRFFSVILGGVLLAAFAGCGSNAPATFPNQLLNADGNPILLDDVEAIVNDETLSEEEKRAQLHDLGIEDEELIDALLPS